MLPTRSGADVFKIASNICFPPQVMPILREFHSDEIPRASRYSQFNCPFRSRSKLSTLLPPFGLRVVVLAVLWHHLRCAGSRLGSTAADITAGSVRAEALGAPVAGVTTSGTWQEQLILRVGLGGTVFDFVGRATGKGGTSPILVRRFAGGDRLGGTATFRRKQAYRR